MNTKKAVVIHSGGMDSSICLAKAIQEFGAPHVLSLSFSYGQRHTPEIIQAGLICADWKVDHLIVNIDFLSKLTNNALLNHEMPILHLKGEAPNTLVLGRNGLMARLGAIYAYERGANILYMGVIEVEEANCGYRDCSRRYIDLMEQILKIDLDDPHFEIRTPVIKMTKKETMDLAHQLGVLPYLLKTTITCYEGIRGEGCKVCPACKLRNDGIASFKKLHPEIPLA